MPSGKDSHGQGSRDPALVELEQYEGGSMSPLTMVVGEISKIQQEGVEVTALWRSTFNTLIETRVIEATVGDSALVQPPYDVPERPVLRGG